jgi:CheY-like chemotaxis protein
MPIPVRLAGACRRRLLIVDDDEVHLRALSRRLRPYRDRVEVQLSDNGIDALVAVGSFKPDLVVLDVFMPEIDGLEVCRRLKRNAQTQNIGVIVTSGLLTSGVEASAREAGALVCVAKPIDLKVVLQHLAPQQRPER